MQMQLKELIEMLAADFQRLRTKYRKDFTEWQDVEDDIKALQQFVPAHLSQPVYAKGH